MAPSRLEPSVPLWNPAQAVSTPRLAQALEKEPLLSPVCIGSETQQLPTAQAQAVLICGIGIAHEAWNSASAGCCCKGKIVKSKGFQDASLLA